MEGEKGSIVKELSEGLERKVKFLLSEEEEFEKFLVRHGFYALENRAFWRVLLNLYDDLSPTRRGLVLLILLLSPSSPPSFPEVEEFVFKSLKVKDKDVLHWAVLCSIFAPSERVVREMTEIVKGGDKGIKEAFLRVGSILISNAEVSKELIGVLLEFVRDDDWFVCGPAAEALGKAVKFLHDGELIKDVVRALLGALGDEEPFVRRATARALGEVVKFLRDEDLVRYVVGALVGTLEGGNSPVDWAAVESNFRVNSKSLDFDAIRNIATYFKKSFKELRSIHSEDVQPYLITYIIATSRFENGCGVKLSVSGLSYQDALSILLGLVEFVPYLITLDFRCLEDKWQELINELVNKEIKKAFLFVIRNFEEGHLRIGSYKGVFQFFEKGRDGRLSLTNRNRGWL